MIIFTRTHKAHSVSLDGDTTLLGESDVSRIAISAFSGIILCCIRKSH